MLFTQVADDLMTEYSSDLDMETLPIEERLDIVKELLQREGFTMDWERKEDEYFIHESSCPYYHVGQSHPEICAVDQTLISKVLDVPIKKVRCMLNGDSSCTYVVPTKNGAKNSS